MSLVKWSVPTGPPISTATKYRNTTTAIYHPAGLCGTLRCSATNMVGAARSSGRRGRRFKSCHPDQYSRRPEALPLPGWGLRFCPYRNEVPQRCSLTALRSDSPSLRSASLVASMPQLADSKAAIQINVLHAPFGLENEGGSGPG